LIISVNVSHLDPCVRKPNQLYYAPAHPPGAAHLYQCRHISGLLLDPADFPEVAPVPVSRSQQPTGPERTTTGTKPGEIYNYTASWADLPRGHPFSVGSATAYLVPMPRGSFSSSKGVETARHSINRRSPRETLTPGLCQARQAPPLTTRSNAVQAARRADGHGESRNVEGNDLPHPYITCELRARVRAT